MFVTLHSGLYRQVAMCLSLCTVDRIDRLQCVCHFARWTVALLGKKLSLPSQHNLLRTHPRNAGVVYSVEMFIKSMFHLLPTIEPLKLSLFEHTIKIP